MLKGELEMIKHNYLCNLITYNAFSSEIEEETERVKLLPSKRINVYKKSNCMFIRKKKVNLDKT